MNEDGSVNRVDVTTAAALYQRGYSLRQIASVQGVKHQSIHAKLIEAGVIRPRRRKKIDKEKVKRILEEIDSKLQEDD